MMFDLEKEIRKWKKSLQKHEVFEDPPPRLGRDDPQGL